MKFAKIAFLTALVVLATPSYAKPKKQKAVNCNTLLDTQLSDVDTQMSEPYRDGVRLHFDVVNKAKKGYVMIDGIVGVRIKGVKDFTFISTETKEWSEPVEQGETGTFTLEVSRSGMNLTALARGGDLLVSSGMLSAQIMYEDGSVKQCGDSGLIFPMMPYINF